MLENNISMLEWKANCKTTEQSANLHCNSAFNNWVTNLNCEPEEILQLFLNVSQSWEETQDYFYLSESPDVFKKLLPLKFISILEFYKVGFSKVGSSFHNKAVSGHKKKEK